LVRTTARRKMTLNAQFIILFLQLDNVAAGISADKGFRYEAAGED
jgi:hypothetical protein